MRKWILNSAVVLLLAGCSWPELVDDVREIHDRVAAIAGDEQVQEDVRELLSRVPAVAANPTNVPGWAGVASAVAALVGSVTYANNRAKKEVRKAMNGGGKNAA